MGPGDVLKFDKKKLVNVSFLFYTYSIHIIYFYDHVNPCVHLCLWDSRVGVVKRGRVGKQCRFSVFLSFWVDLPPRWLPDRPFHSIGASKSVDWQDLCSLLTSIGGFWDTKIVKGWVGPQVNVWRDISAHHRKNTIRKWRRHTRRPSLI